MQTFCSNCGSALAGGARFCPACGTAVAGMAGAMPPMGFPPAQQRLVRPLFGRQFAGVCAGVARTYDWDLGLVRVLTVVAGIFLFPIVEVIYIAGWIGIPEETATDVQFSQAPPPQV